MSYYDFLCAVCLFYGMRSCQEDYFLSLALKEPLFEERVTSAMISITSLRVIDEKRKIICGCNEVEGKSVSYRVPQLWMFFLIWIFQVLKKLLQCSIWAQIDLN